MKKRHPYYPIYLDIEERPVLIVGGGSVCARKAETMMRYGARVTVVAKEAGEEIAAWASEGKLALVARAYEEHDLEGAALVIASTDDPCVNARVARDCRRRRIPVNVVDVTHLCEFIVPAIVDRGSVHIAISTEGKSPALARTLRETLQEAIGPEWAELNDLLGTLRAGAKNVLPTDVDRKRFFDSILAAGVLEHLRQGRRGEAYGAIAALCRANGVPLSEALEAKLGKNAHAPGA